MIENRQFERVNNMIACKSYLKYEDFPENREIFVHELKHSKTDEVDNFILIGCESDEFCENGTLFKFWSTKFLEIEIKMRDFKIKGWSFMNLGKRNKSFTVRGV